MDDVWGAADVMGLRRATADVLEEIPYLDETTFSLRTVSSRLAHPPKLDLAGPPGRRELSMTLLCNGCHATVVSSRWRGREFLPGAARRIELVAGNLRAAWLAMSYRQQARRVAQVLTSRSTETTTAILIDHADLRVLDITGAAPSILRTGALQLQIGDLIPEPLCGLLSMIRVALVRGETPKRLHSLSGVTMRVFAAEPGFGGEVLLADADRTLIMDRLTPRQAEVIALANQGRANKEIAADLGISIATVKKHLESIYGLLGVSSRTAATHRLYRATYADADL